MPFAVPDEVLGGDPPQRREHEHARVVAFEEEPDRQAGDVRGDREQDRAGEQPREQHLDGATGDDAQRELLEVAVEIENGLAEQRVQREEYGQRHAGIPPGGKDELGGGRCCHHGPLASSFQRNDRSETGASMSAMRSSRRASRRSGSSDSGQPAILTRYAN